MNDLQLRERDIFLKALDISSPDELAAYLDDVCRDDAQLRRNVEALLEANKQTGDVFDRSGVAATIDGTRELPAAPGTVIGPYKLREKIGEGGFGVVYVAEQTTPVRRKVALKIIKPGMDTREIIARFEAERQALAMMDHPNIARVLDAGTTGEYEPRPSSEYEPRPLGSGLPDPVAHAPGSFGRPYFVMELVKGIPITEFCDEQKLSTRERLELFIQVCRAVQHAHQKGIIHRDIKPSNVMVTLSDATPVPKVIDFGVAKALSSKLTEKTVYTAYGQMIGTPLYMSPEQAQLKEHDIDTRSDIYSLGVLLYELLTGTTPFDKETLQKSGFDEMRRIIREVDPPRPSARISTLKNEALSTLPSPSSERRGLSPPSGAGGEASPRRRIDAQKLAQSLRGELDWIVMKALDKDRTRRYETANGLARDIERYLTDEPVHARPPSTTYRFQKFARRNKGILTAAAIVGTALVLGIVGTTAEAIRATKAERLAGDRLTLANQRLENEQQARRDAEAERKRAEENLRKAREAVDKYFTLVSESTLLDEPGLVPLREELIEAALTYYESFAARRSNDPQVQLELAATHLRLAQIYHALGRRNDMLLALEDGFPLVDKAMQEQPPESDEYLALAGFWHGARGTSSAGQQIADHAHALTVLQTGIALWERLVKAHPTVVGFQSDLSKFYNIIDNEQLALGRPEDALQSMTRVVEIREGIIRQHPDVPEHIAELSNAYWGLAQNYRQSDPDQAEQFYRRAIKTRENLDSAIYQDNLADQYREFGRFLLQRDRTVDASKELANAIAVCNELIAAYPHVAAYHNKLAESKGLQRRALKAAGDTEGLAKLLSETNPHTAQEYLERAATHQELHQYANALADYEAAIQIEPINPNIQWNYAALITSHLSKKEAISTLSRLIRDYPTSSTYYRYRGIMLDAQGQYDAALHDLNMAVEFLSDDGDPRTYYNRAKLFTRMEDYEKAAADYDEFVQRSSDSSFAHFARGEFYLNSLKDYEKALADFDKSLEIFPNAAYRYKRRALAHFHLKHYDKALADITQAVELNPADKSNLTWINPALVAACPDEEFRKGLLELADRTVERTGGDPDAYFSRGLLNATFGDPSKAQADFEKAFSSDAGSYYTHYWHALFCLKMDDQAAYRDACRLMLEQFAKTKKPNEAHFTAWTCALAPNALKDYTPAVQLAGRAVQQKPENHETLQALGAVLYRAGRFQEALEHLNQAAGIETTDRSSPAYGWYFLAMAHQKLGNADHAQQWLDKANAQAESELNDDSNPPTWNRRLTLQLLRTEAETLIHGGNQKSEVRDQ